MKTTGAARGNHRKISRNIKGKPWEVQKKTRENYRNTERKPYGNHMKTVGKL